MVDYLFNKVPSVTKYSASETIKVVGQFNLSGVALAQNDTIGSILVPSGAVITNVEITSTELDTDAAPTLNLQFGDSNNLARFINNFSASDPISIQTINNFLVTGGDIVSGPGYKYENDSELFFTVAADPATGATTGSLVVIVTYNNNAL